MRRWWRTCARLANDRGPCERVLTRRSRSGRTGDVEYAARRQKPDEGDDCDHYEGSHRAYEGNGDRADIHNEREYLFAEPGSGLDASPSGDGPGQYGPGAGRGAEAEDVDGHRNRPDSAHAYPLGAEWDE